MIPRMLIWGALLMSTVIYLFVASLYSGPDGDDKYVPVLYGIALFQFLFTWFGVRRIFKTVTDPWRMTVIVLAMYEACAIMGLIAAFLTKDWRYYLLPWALTLIGFIREFPREAAAGEPPAPV